MSPEEEALVHCDTIWLHAHRYSGAQWTFEAPSPAWAEKSLFAQQVNESQDESAFAKS